MKQLSLEKINNDENDSDMMTKILLAEKIAIYKASEFS